MSKGLSGTVDEFPISLDFGLEVLLECPNEIWLLTVVYVSYCSILLDANQPRQPTNSTLSSSRVS